MQEICPMLPERIGEAVLAASALHGGDLQEIRLYSGACAAVVIRGKMIKLREVCPERDFRATVMRLCGNSLYAHSDTIREGYIYTAGGIRVGICGRAVAPCGTVERVVDITSLCIRLPVRIPGAADDLLPYIFRGGGVHGLLVWSPPGVGKTTILRELTAALSDADPFCRAAVVDSRQEITSALGQLSIDVLLGYPRAIGMEIAVRTLSPQIVLCDEISGNADVEAVLKCAASGAAVVATVHAGCREDLMRRKEIRCLLECSVFPTLVGLKREGAEVRHLITGGQVNI